METFWCDRFHTAVANLEMASAMLEVRRLQEERIALAIQPWYRRVSPNFDGEDEGDGDDEEVESSFPDTQPTPSDQH